MQACIEREREWGSECNGECNLNRNVTSLYFNPVSTWIYLALLHPAGVTERGTEGSELRTGHRNPRKTLIIHQPLPQMKKCPKPAQARAESQARQLIISIRLYFFYLFLACLKMNLLELI